MYQWQEWRSLWHCMLRWTRAGHSVLAIGVWTADDATVGEHSYSSSYCSSGADDTLFFVAAAAGADENAGFDAYASAAVHVSGGDDDGDANPLAVEEAESFPVRRNPLAMSPSSFAQQSLDVPLLFFRKKVIFFHHVACLKTSPSALLERYQVFSPLPNKSEVVIVLVHLEGSFSLI